MRLNGDIRSTPGSKVMPLLDILTDIAVEIGQTNGESDRKARIRKVNKAVKEIHRSTDLEEAMDERIIDLNTDSAQQIALPAYVYQVRGARYVDGRTTITLEDMRNRYNFNFTGENEVWYFQYRERKRGPLTRELQNQSIIKVSIPLANGEAWSITLTGRTDNAFRASETLQFSATDIEKTGILNFLDLESAVKDRVTNYDVTLKDVEDREVGKILNSTNQTMYKIYQVADTENFIQPANASGVEFRFKYVPQTLKDDNDCYLGTDKYDDAIVWKFLEHRCKEPKEALLYAAKCKQILDQGIVDEMAGKRTKINFRPQPFFQLTYGKVWRDTI